MQLLTIFSATPLTDFPVLNALAVHAVPEPGTVALLALGAAILFGSGWHRRRAG